ncbi:MAG: pimeloyl-[acyl-carrier protein] methyl ester esterase [Gammaproteobacteria bacterium]|jgi:pimeloyl-[acyl-carrier protein] methyl ester esterase
MRFESKSLNEKSGVKKTLSVNQLSNRSGQGGPITLLHGWGMSASVFDPLRDLLSLSHQLDVVAVDLPGYGQNQWDESLSFEDQAALISEQVPEGVLLGWSMGGLYAIEMARQDPGRFNRLILMCCNPCFVCRESWPLAVDESVFDDFSQSLQSGWRSTIKHFLSLQMLGNPNARQLVRNLMIKLEKAGEPDEDALRFGLDLLKSADARSALSQLKIPIDMIFGGLDALVPVNVAKEISKVNPRIQVELLLDAAHAPFLSHTAQIASMIIAK